MPAWFEIKNIVCKIRCCVPLEEKNDDEIDGDNNVCAENSKSVVKKNWFCLKSNKNASKEPVPN